jgi:hypothetical protein
MVTPGAVWYSSHNQIFDAYKLGAASITYLVDVFVGDFLVLAATLNWMMFVIQLEALTWNC